jgi:hypothetical protein
VGTWTLDWWGMKDGVACFDSDGTFWYKHDLTGDLLYCGTWHLFENKLTMREFLLNKYGVGYWSTPLVRHFDIEVKGSHVYLDRGIWLRPVP